MRSPLSAALLAATLLFTGAASQAATLATFGFSEEYNLPSGGGGPSAAIRVQFSYSLAPGGLTDLSTLVFDTLALGDGDNGRVFTLDGAGDAQLAGFFARATNGSDDDFRVDVIGVDGGGIGRVAPESGMLLPRVTVTGPDLDGYTLSSLELFIDDIVIDSQAGAGGFHWRVSGELRFIGAPDSVPVPGALALFASALSCVALGRRRRARPSIG